MLDFKLKPIFATASAASKNDTWYKNGENWHNHLVTLIYSMKQTVVLQFPSLRLKLDLVSISPTFYVRLFCMKVLQSFLCLHFRFELFLRKNIGANELMKCWWNWPKEFYDKSFSSNIFLEKESLPKICLHLRPI